MKPVTFLRSLVILTFVSVFSTALNAGVEQQSAPDFTLKSQSGKNLKLSDYRGEVVMINFWASWCGPCRQEMPLLDDLYQKYKPLGFTLLGVNVEENTKQAESFIRKSPVSFPVLYDSRNSVSKLYDVSAMPTTVIIDRDGTVRELFHGYKPGYEQKYHQLVRSLIRE